MLCGHHLRPHLTFQAVPVSTKQMKGGGANKGNSYSFVYIYNLIKPVAALNVEASISVKTSQVSHDVIFEGGLVVLRLPVVQVLQPVTGQQLLVGLLIVLQS